MVTYLPDGALCAAPGVDPNLFFPTRGKSAEPARRICRQCPIQPACEQSALTRGERDGVWAGWSERERRHVQGWVPRSGGRRHKSMAGG